MCSPYSKQRRGHHRLPQGQAAHSHTCARTNASKFEDDIKVGRGGHKPGRGPGGTGARLPELHTPPLLQKRRGTATSAQGRPRSDRKPSGSTRGCAVSVRPSYACVYLCAHTCTREHAFMLVPHGQLGLAWVGCLLPNALGVKYCGCLCSFGTSSNRVSKVFSSSPLSRKGKRP